MRLGDNELEGISTLIQVYTGNGKGKTTAALGLAIRAAGAGLKVYIGQFLKGKKCSEHNALKKVKNIKIEQFGKICFIKKNISQKDLKSAKTGLAVIKRIITKKEYDVIILDEINVALKLNLLDLDEVIRVINDAPQDIELVLTGRDIAGKILKLADLVSEIKEIKHYFKKGVNARRGIEY